MSKRIARLESDLGASRGTVSPWTALADGSLDAAFGRVTRVLPPGIERTAACLEPICLPAAPGAGLLS